MPVPVQIQLFDAFLGTQEGIGSIILPDVFSSGGSKNLYIDKYGRAKKIDGYSKQNPSAITSNTGSVAERCRALFPYRKNTGGTTTRQVVAVFTDDSAHWEVRTSADGGASWTFQSDITAAVGKIPSFAQFGNTLYLTTSISVPKKWDGTTLSAAGSTQSPTPIAVDATTAGQLTGNFLWKLVTINADASRKYGSPASTTIPLQGHQATITWSADADVTATGYELYRTTGQGDVFYYVDYVAGRATVTYTDNVSDLTILQNRVLEEHGDPPPSGVYFAIPHKQRVWWLRTDALPTRGWFSDPALPDSVYTASNYIEFSDSETVGDSITGGVGNYESLMVVFTERAVWEVSGTGNVIGNIVDWTRIRTNAQTGTVSGRTIARVPAGSKYSDQKGQIQTTPVVTLAYLTPLGDIRLFDGDNDIVISNPVKTTLATLNYAQRAKAFALHDTVRSEVTWCLPTGSATENAQAVTWNYRWGVWYLRDWSFAHGVEADDASNAQVLLGGESSTSKGGYVYHVWSGNSFDGADITAQWMTKTLYGVNNSYGQTTYGQPAMSQSKRFRWVDFLFETNQNVTLTVEWLRGNTPDNGASFGSTLITPSTSTVLDVGGDTILSLGGDSIAVSAASSLIRAILQDTSGHYLHDPGIRLRVSDSSSNGAWSLEAMSVAYQILPGTQRRMQG